MYSVYADDVCIHSDIYTDTKYRAFNPVLSLSDNTAGVLEMTLPQTNVGYGIIVPFSTIVTVYRESEEIWSGRVIKEKKDFFNNRMVTCEGVLSYLNDTTQPPKEYVDREISYVLASLLQKHNDKVEEHKKFKMGEVTSTDIVNLITSEEHTLDVILDELIDQYGGHLRVRRVDGELYLDYLKDYPDTNPQEIRFGVNLLDFTTSLEMDDIATAILPRGINLGESDIPGVDNYLDVSSVNGGSIYVTNEEGISRFGWVEKVVDFEDVEDEQELLDKAIKYLGDVQFDNLVIEVKSLDLRYLSKTEDSINLLDEVRCISLPHGLDRKLPVKELEIHLDSPGNSVYTIGEELKNSLTSDNQKDRESINDRINDMSDKIDNLDFEEILDAAKDNATQIMNDATRGYVTITRDNNNTRSESIVISNDTSYNPLTDRWSPQTKLWRWNIGGLAFSNNGGMTYEGPAITMDGEIVADAITTGHMSANRIRAGTISSLSGNTKWDLNTGELTMNKGTIDIGGEFKVDADGSITSTSGKIGGFDIRTWSISNDAISLDDTGLSFHDYSGETLGGYGVGFWYWKQEYSGLTVRMEPENTYITWGHREYSTDAFYTVKLTYSSEPLPSLPEKYHGPYETRPSIYHTVRGDYYVVEHPTSQGRYEVWQSGLSYENPTWFMVKSSVLLRNIEGYWEIPGNAISFGCGLYLGGWGIRDSFDIMDTYGNDMYRETKHYRAVTLTTTSGTQGTKRPTDMSTLFGTVKPVYIVNGLLMTDDD